MTVATFPTLGYPQPSHELWTPEQIDHARFVRWCVVAGRWTDGEESTAEWARSRKLEHLGPVRNRPSDWSLADAEQHETKPLVRQGDPGDEAFDPAQSQSA